MVKKARVRVESMRVVGWRMMAASGGGLEWVGQSRWVVQLG